MAVKSPRLQEMHLSPRELVIYYPDRDLAFVAHLAPPQPPPMLDALAAGLVDPASTLPAGSKLLDRKRANGELLTRWRVVDGGGKELGELNAVETRQGARSIELVDGKGQPQRRFTFGDRVRVGIRTVPRTVVADYYAPGGARQREEQWTLERIARFDPQNGHRWLREAGAADENPAALVVIRRYVLVMLAVALGGVGRARAAGPAPDAPELWKPEQAVAYLLNGSFASPTQERAAAWDGALGSGVTRALFGTYHLVLSSQDAGGCVFSPSCSRFSQAVIGRCGFFQGALLTLDRLLRDHPLAVPFYPRVEGGRLLRDDPARYCLAPPE